MLSKFIMCCMLYNYARFCQVYDTKTPSLEKPGENKTHELELPSSGRADIVMRKSRIRTYATVNYFLFTDQP